VGGKVRTRPQVVLETEEKGHRYDRSFLMVHVARPNVNADVHEAQVKVQADE